MRRRRQLLLVATVLACLGAGGASGAPRGADAAQDGVVRSGGTPLGNLRVTLLEAGPARPRVLAQTCSGPDGRFHLTYRRPADPRAVLYLTADGGSGGLRLAATVDGGSAVVVNERTTVAAAYAFAQFTHDGEVAGGSPGLPNAAAISHNLADVRTGGVAPLLAAPPNGRETSTLAAFDTLANLLAVCARGGDCGTLLRLAQPPGEARPQDSFQAAADIARAPGHDAAALFALARTQPVYRPALAAAPDAWTLALRYDGNGHEVNGPGNIAFDAAGNAWVSNNYPFALNPLTSVCGGRAVLALSPTGADLPGAPYRGGGLYGAGFGIAVDRNGQAWVSNFGFQGKGCPVDPSRHDRSVSEFAADGRALSPGTGWRFGGISQPQGTVADRSGNVWIANCGNRSVTRIPDGRPEAARNLPLAAAGLVKPFDIAVDPRGRAWVTGNGSDNVVELAPDGRPLRTVTPPGLHRPLGIASDSLGDLWVADDQILPVPCEGSTTADLAGALSTVPGPGHRPGVVLIRPDGTAAPAPFTNGGLVLPWGVAVDGDDHVWVANFAGRRLAELCGARVSTCPPGYRTGQPISPAATGYPSDGLVRNTGVQIDPSGNVWLANNWRQVPLQTNPGGHELVVFVGLAAPVLTPQAGPPQRP
ncbi:DNA-binding beta-propeller fold protein YncE [Streptacidiphilus sp. MAP12-33]|uniref:NHL repeat-containing protein n=1 Tax=Streptacidiphilus sp. MAP12-33 TaxID=3156266 RepID=UPI003517B396